MTTRMRPIESTIPLEDALRIIEAAVQPIQRIERVALADAHDRVLAHDVGSTIDVPPFARAAMDGYAVRAADTNGASRGTPRSLTRIGQVFTGQVTPQRVQSGQCIEIATGAPLPDGADAVVIVEDTASTVDRIDVFTAVEANQNIGRQGADIHRGQTVLYSGDLLTPGKIGVIAALGLTEVDVYARPRVAVLSTGNEIVDPGQPLAAGQIYDINKFTVSALVSRHGGIPVAYRTPMDTLEDLSRGVDEGCREDVLVFSGGSSVGERDLMLDVIAAKGEVLFHGISVKPGKPTAFGRIGTSLDGGQSRLVFGMPGYPTSCLTNGYLLLVPALRKIARLPPWQPHVATLPLGARISSVTGRRQFYTVRVEKGVVLPAFKASGDITSMSRADGYIDIPADVTGVDQGTPVDVVFF
ncbi:MAG TPA: gephyrin-like molybdotransferase Glp [Vicinamibacterales bacterium]|nr:gephyrin-like molybdotransferase Glp [Vicinamibacterales bacterium]